MKKWFKSGGPWIWLAAGAVSISMVMILGLITLLFINSLGNFWPKRVVEISYAQENEESIRYIGEIINQTQDKLNQSGKIGISIFNKTNVNTRKLLRLGNRDFFNQDFVWVSDNKIKEQDYPKDIVTIERQEWGNAYGYIKAIKERGKIIAEIKEANKLWSVLQERLARSHVLTNQVIYIKKHEINIVNNRLEKLRLYRRKLEIQGITDKAVYDETEVKFQDLQRRYEESEKKLNSLYRQNKRDELILEAADGQLIDIPFSKIIHLYHPNQMGIGERVHYSFQKIYDFIVKDPREANTEGGVFPAIFGTIAMVLIMSILVTPFGVLAAVYLHEYATQGLLVRIVRIAVNNLAGVPSIVYGIFGLGFFVYFLGGNIDQWFFPEVLPAPTFGTPGLLWASLTLAILTVPVVIVTTEEGLSTIPRSIREGSLALGATQAETLWRTVLPMAAPAMITGLILAVARAAGEVAPLMLVGVVSFAPTLPLDEGFPFIHLNREFMHLGFHIYDVGFQSPNIDAVQPLVYATALLLILIIVGLNLTAIIIRNRLRERYHTAET
ncbi:phosphate ABC transporter permease PstA [Candidatus Nitrosacidococcus tergens]|uniref:Phosphate transport system permease protein PstA n=1 Tax=Candidatus Nitrosacidococcus tergens TaxID=553981 RepID=A0A7G1Q8J0_9GAMM|nr:phosphate ABC transporter permease PstA [Candidatus Nitrosacidococcus tergens]CAB1274720.1 Phosphate ABC transporter, inner membrane subunit PstA [Candidatus Nitrosacidococcus tergens]